MHQLSVATLRLMMASTEMMTELPMLVPTAEQPHFAASPHTYAHAKTQPPQHRRDSKMHRPGIEPGASRNCPVKDGNG